MKTARERDTPRSSGWKRNSVTTPPPPSRSTSTRPRALVGPRGEGFKQMLLLMNNARIGVGFESLGLCESAWRMAAEYASVRQSMGKTIDQHEPGRRHAR